MDKNMFFMIFTLSYGLLMPQVSLKIVKIVNIPKLFGIENRSIIKGVMDKNMFFTIFTIFLVF